MKKVAIIGLGYVGLPLALEFGKVMTTVGFDINKNRVVELKNGEDGTKEADKEELKSSKVNFTSEIAEIENSDCFIVTVPTPVDENYKPDLAPLKSASRLIGGVLKKGDVVIYESTVFPGCTEEVCVPVLEETSGLKFNKDFFCGYSPERINPGDKERTLVTIKKITSGSTPEIAEQVDDLYQKIIKAGTFRASSIKVAEAAKVIENSQRDINIAFVNELAQIFDYVGIDTKEVLEAAGTKWNFLPFKPGLVGGHCIGIDPYYLTEKAKSLGYNPELILAGRKINESMPEFIANKVLSLMEGKGIILNDASVLVLGVTFKENCPDVRNSKVVDLVNKLKLSVAEVDAYDPEADSKEVEKEYGINLINEINKKYQAVVLAVPHEQFLALDFAKLLDDTAVLYDVKGVLNKSAVSGRL